MALNKKKIVE